MKRLVWILLAIVSTAFAQVQPVAIATQGRHSCPCCNCNGSCGMPGCRPPASARALPTANQPAGVAATASREVAAPIRQSGEKFFAAFVKSAVTSTAARVPERVTPSAPVPLFAAHCSFLI